MSDVTERNEDGRIDDIAREILAEDELEEKRRRGIHLLPNAITTGAMFFGFYSIMMSISGNYRHAVWALVAAGIMDLLDGRIARLVKGTSAFGQEYDSLSDLIAFGFAPAILAYFWALNGFGRLGWGVAFLYLACAAIRLAKFNTLTEEEESKKYFRGIPSPGAAGLIVVIVMMHIDYYPQLYQNGLAETGEAGLPPDAALARGGMLIWVILVSLLMVSNVRFRTFKDIRIKKYGPWLPLAGLAGVIAIFMARPEQTLFAVATTYLVLGLVEGGIVFHFRERELREVRRQRRRERRTMRKLERAKARQARREAKEKKKESSIRAVK